MTIPTFPALRRQGQGACQSVSRLHIGMLLKEGRQEGKKERVEGLKLIKHVTHILGNS